MNKKKLITTSLSLILTLIVVFFFAFPFAHKTMASGWKENRNICPTSNGPDCISVILNPMPANLSTYTVVASRANPYDPKTAPQWKNSFTLTPDPKNHYYMTDQIMPHIDNISYDSKQAVFNITVTDTATGKTVGQFGGVPVYAGLNPGAWYQVTVDIVTTSPGGTPTSCNVKGHLQWTDPLDNKVRNFGIFSTITITDGNGKTIDKSKIAIDGATGNFTVVNVPLGKYTLTAVFPCSGNSTPACPDYETINAGPQSFECKGVDLDLGNIASVSDKQPPPPPPTDTPFPGPPLPPCSQGAWVNGKCGSVDSGFGALSTDVGAFIKSLFGVVLSVSGGIALLLIIKAGYQLMTSQGKPEQLQQGRDQLIAAIVGLIFLIFSFVFLQLIGYNILGIPGFGGVSGSGPGVLQVGDNCDMIGNQQCATGLTCVTLGNGNGRAGICKQSTGASCDMNANYNQCPGGQTCVSNGTGNGRSGTCQ